MAGLLSFLMVVQPVAGQIDRRHNSRASRISIFCGELRKPAPKSAQTAKKTAPASKKSAKTRSPCWQEGQKARQPGGSRGAAGADGADQAGLSSLDRVAADGPATGHDAHSGGVCGGNQVRARATRARRRRRLIWRWATPICWTSATERRLKTSAWRRRPARSWPTTPTF